MPKPPRDEHGSALNKDGTVHASTGTAPYTKTYNIPPVDMPDLVKKGIAPEQFPNWDREDPESNWYLRARKLTFERKAILLAKLESVGVMTIAARWAGVTCQTVRAHRKEDLEFDEACTEAENMYHALTAASITHQARAGQMDERWDKEGNLLSRRVSFETPIRIKMLDRADPSYNSVSRQEVAVVGGAVVVPAPTDLSVESWDDVVRRHTGTPQMAQSVPSIDSGPAALSEGRVVKRTVVETDGTPVDADPDAPASE